MRLSKDFFYTLREDAKDEDSVSGNLLVKSGMIKKVSNGIYMNMPLGEKVSKNVIKTMDAANNNWNKAYDKINKANFTDKVKNIYNYKKHGNIRGDKLSANELRKLGIKTFNYKTR